MLPIDGNSVFTQCSQFSEFKFLCLAFLRSLLDWRRRLPPPDRRNGRNNHYEKDQTDTRSISDEFHCTSFGLGCAFLRLQLSDILNVSFGTRCFISRLLRILTHTLGINSCFVGWLAFGLLTRKLVSHICYCVWRFCLLRRFNRQFWRRCWRQCGGIYSCEAGLKSCFVGWLA